MSKYLAKAMQRFIAETCIGAPALRNQGAPGLVGAARKFFKKMKLASIPKDAGPFAAWLDEQTIVLLDHFPPAARHFGTARKALNLFLRSATYNIVLNREYGLDALLPLLEVPLDSYVARHLRHCVPSLPRRWAGLKRLDAATHRQYQKAAAFIAEWDGGYRVDADVFFFRKPLPKTRSAKARTLRHLAPVTTGHARRASNLAAVSS